MYAKNSCTKVWKKGQEQAKGCLNIQSAIPVEVVIKRKLSIFQ
jgi:hypothetical protein